MKDFGVVGSEEIILVKCFGEGSINLIKGFVINPNTCKGQKQYVKNPSKCFAFPRYFFFFFHEMFLVERMRS